MKILFLFSLALAAFCMADDFDFDIDLSRLRPSAEAPSEDRRIFGNIEKLPGSLRGLPVEEGAVEELHFPAGPVIVVANAASIPAAYELLAKALQTEGVEARAPLTLLIHADNQVSVGIPVRVTESNPLPLGCDLALLPERKLLLTRLTLSQATRSDPELLQAVARIRRDALDRRLQLDTRELHLFPQQDDSVLLGLPAQ